MDSDETSSADRTASPRNRGLAEWAARYRLASIIVAISAVVFAIGAALLIINRDVATPEIWAFRGFTALLAVPYGTVGWLIATRRPANPIGWVFLGILFGGALMMATYEYGLAGSISGWELPLAQFSAWVVSWVWLPPAFGGSLLLFLLFPDGRLPSAKWRVVLVGGLLSVIVGVIVIALAPASPADGPYFASLYPFGNPYGLRGADWLLPAVVIAIAVSGLFLLAAAIGRLWRLRVATGVERRQLTWIAYASAFIPITAVIGTLTYPNDLLETLNVASFGLVAIAAGVAILRYRLYDIDIIVNRTLVYVPLTAFVGGLYSASVALFQRLFVAVTGETSDAAIVISTLILAASFTSVKNWLQARVDRRFKEPMSAGPMLTKLISEVQKAVYRPDPERLARRILHTAVEATEARGGELRLREGRRTITVATPEWGNGVGVEVVAPIRRDGTQIGHLALAGREDGRRYPPAEVAALERALAGIPEALR